LYLRSSGGAEYARASAAELGIEDCFVAFLPKPDVYLDDQPVHEWRYCQHVLPGNAGDAWVWIWLANVRFSPVADVRPIEAGSAVLMSASDPKHTLREGISGRGYD